MINEEYNDTCPECKCRAYIGFKSVECSNSTCKFYPKDKKKPTGNIKDYPHPSECCGESTCSGDSYCDPCMDDDPFLFP